jgi:cytochrome c2
MKMKSFLRNKLVFLILISFVATAVFCINGCKASQQVSNKPGVQLWAENCQRCHNTPSPTSFSPEQWETIGMHMQTRALITDEERTKIVAFLKQ